MQLSAWPAWVNLTAAVVVVFFSSALSAPTSFTAHCGTPRTSSNTPRGSYVPMVLLILGEIGGFGVLLAGFVAGQLLR